MKYVFGILFIVIGIFGTFYFYASNVQYYIGPETDHFDGTHFFNPYDENKRPFYNFLKWQLTRDKEKWPERIAVEKYDVPPVKYHGGIRATYVGHATVLIQVDGINILTDPIWSERCSPVTWAGPKRVVDPGIKFDDLPKIDAVLVSHNHYDHLDHPTLRALVFKHKPKIITSLGNDYIITSESLGAKVVSKDWFEDEDINDDVKVTVVPVVHWSGRLGADRNKALWSGFVIHTRHGRIYFSGDTAFGTGVMHKLVLEKMGSMKLSLIAIGTYEPRDFMKGVHNNTDDAMEMYKLMESEYAMGIHHGVFQLSDENIETQQRDYKASIEKYGVDPGKFIMPKVGEVLEIKG